MNNGNILNNLVGKENIQRTIVNKDAIVFSAMNHQSYLTTN